MSRVGSAILCRHVKNQPGATENPALDVRLVALPGGIQLLELPAKEAVQGDGVYARVRDFGGQRRIVV